MPTYGIDHQDGPQRLAGERGDRLAGPDDVDVAPLERRPHVREGDLDQLRSVPLEARFHEGGAHRQLTEVAERVDGDSRAREAGRIPLELGPRHREQLGEAGTGRRAVRHGAQGETLGIGDQERRPGAVGDVEVAADQGGDGGRAALGHLDGHRQPLGGEQPLLDRDVDRRDVDDRERAHGDLGSFGRAVGGRWGRGRRGAGPQNEGGEDGGDVGGASSVRHAGTIRVATRARWSSPPPGAASRPGPRRPARDAG